MRLFGVIVFFSIIMASCMWLLASFVGSIDTTSRGHLLESSSSRFFINTRLPIPLLNFNTIFHPSTNN